MQLRLIKNFLKAMGRKGPVFSYLKQKFFRISDTKLKDRIFGRLNFRTLYKDWEFDVILEGGVHILSRQLKSRKRQGSCYESFCSYKKLECNIHIIKSGHI